MRKVTIRYKNRSMSQFSRVKLVFDDGWNTFFMTKKALRLLSQIKHMKGCAMVGRIHKMKSSSAQHRSRNRWLTEQQTEKLAAYLVWITN